MSASDLTTGDLPNEIKLKGSLNYVPWVGDITVLLISKSLDQYIAQDSVKPVISEVITPATVTTSDGTISAPPTVSTGPRITAIDVVKWVSEDTKARMAIIRNIQTKPRELINGCTSALDM